MIKQLILILLYTAPLISEAQSDRNINLEISQSGSLQNFVDDTITVRLEIKNTGNKDINIYCWKGKTISKAINTSLKFCIVNGEDTLIYNYIGSQVKLPYKGDFLSIKPDSSYAEYINLNKYYIPKTNGETNKRTWPKGTYNISCIYEYTHDDGFKYGKELWEGKLVSNKINVKIK